MSALGAEKIILIGILIMAIINKDSKRDGVFKERLKRKDFPLVSYWYLLKR
jgi:hypothetical protein